MQTADQSTVDAVITWVDGNDPAHRARLDAFLRESGQAGLAAAHPTRFNDCGEIEYCVASLLRFAPWLRTIFILSDNQVPALIARLRGTAYEHRVRVVDHREIFSGFEQYLPTFSNRAIECLMWRIPGLAERFIYFNDDFQLLRPVAVEDFFHPDGIVVRGAWRPAGMPRAGQRLRAALAPLLLPRGRDDDATRPRNHAAQLRSAELAGFSGRYFRVPHVPHPMRKSVVQAWLAGHPEQWAENVRHRLRSDRQFVTTALACHLELAAGTARVDNLLSVLRLKVESQSLRSLRRQTAGADQDPRVAFSCTQSLDLADGERRQHIFAWLDRRIGRLDALLSSVQVHGIDIDRPAYPAGRFQPVQARNPVGQR